MPVTRERIRRGDSWHNGEPPSDVPFFFVFNTSFNGRKATTPPLCEARAAHERRVVVSDCVDVWFQRMSSSFLSYARSDDEPFVERLYAELRAAGSSV
jgi:hypothetical protein